MAAVLIKFPVARRRVILMRASVCPNDISRLSDFASFDFLFAFPEISSDNFVRDDLPETSLIYF